MENQSIPKVSASNTIKPWIIYPAKKKKIMNNLIEQIEMDLWKELIENVDSKTSYELMSLIDFYIN